MNAQPDYNRIPPHSHEAEKSVLGAMMISQKAAYRAIGDLKAEDFYFGAHVKPISSCRDFAGYYYEVHR